jgi:nucleoside-diphosphate-sugar epimerase
MKEVEVTYHLAWSFRAGRCHPHRQPDAERREIKHNLTGTANVLQAALLAKVRHLVFCSSAVVYGPTGPARVTEDHVCHPELTALGGPVYGITKLACEKLSLVYQRRGLPVTAFRLHGVFKENRLAQFGTMIRQARGGKALQPVRGAGGEYIHMDDVLTAFLLAMDEPQAQGVVFNLAGSYTYDDVELAQHIVQVTGSRSHVKPLHDPLQSMVSVSVDKLRQRLGFLPQRGEFLTGLIASAFAA